MWKKRVWRTIEIRGSQTLHHLHQAIQGAFGWDDDHLYSFYMSGEPWDPETEYSAPGAGEGRKAHQVKIGGLGLVPTQRFLYLFDYGDELMHEVRVEGVGPAVAGCKYPRVVKSHGEAPPQYPDLEEEELPE
jgi:hypothetical protein